MAFSRVYVGVHYPGDIIFGGLLGYGLAWAVSKPLGYNKNERIEKRKVTGLSINSAMNLPEDVIG